MRSPYIQVAEVDGHPIGVVQVTLRGEVADLARLFVEPTRLRMGVGRKLLEWAEATARSAGARMLVIEADPGAADFYRRMGASDAGAVPSGSKPGRFIPRLTLLL